MIVPVADQAAQQIGPAQNGAVAGRRSAQHDVIAARGACVPAVEHEFLGAQPRLAGLFVKRRRQVNEFRPVAGRLNIHLDDARDRG